MAQLAPLRPQAQPTRIRLVYEVEARDHLFLLDEDDMPESLLHDDILVLLQSLLRAWASRAGRSVRVARNLACRWEPADARTGVDPDLCVIEPPPDGQDTLTQLRLWEGHTAPWLGIEVVSPSTAPKDYHDAPVRYARLGASELWVFDPLREGPADTGGPFVLQVWRREGDRMERTHAGSGPARSPGLDAWLVVTDGGRRLRLSDDPEGTRLWPTEAGAEAVAREQERAEKERERADKERERAAREQERAEKERAIAAREQAEAEVAELRARLALLEGKTR